jgi:hypothetical protein
MGDTLDWGKAQGRAETSALWTPSSWKASPCYNLLKEQLVLHAKPHLIGPQNDFSTDCGISDPWAHSSAPPRSCSPKLPPFRPAWSPLDWDPKACQAGEPQTLMISAGLHPSGLHRPAWSPLSGLCPQGLLNWQSTGIHNLHQARVPKTCQGGDPQAGTISTPQGCLLRPAKPAIIHRHSQSTLCQAHLSKDCTGLHDFCSTGLCP